jgi:hypothetical protein
VKFSSVGLIVLIGFSAAFGLSRTQGKATLVASITGSGPRYFEGAYAYFEVRSKGVRIEQKRLVDKSVSFSLAEGTYELSGYVRPCDGNCRLLDPPTDECHGTFSLKAGETLYAIRKQTDSGACTLTFSSTQSSNSN